MATKIETMDTHIPYNQNKIVYSIDMRTSKGQSFPYYFKTIKQFKKKKNLHKGIEKFWTESHSQSTGASSNHTNPPPLCHPRISRIAIIKG